MDHAIVVEDVSKRFRLYHERNQSLKVALMRRGRAHYEEFWALRDVDLQIPQGKTFGLVGHNGSGKSTLLKTMARILVPDSGKITMVGRVSALLELGAGFHPELSGRDNVYLNGSILGLTKRDIDARFDEIVGFAGLEQFIDTPVKNYSSGMYVRLGFSVAINVEPDILLVDEVLAVGDDEFQRRSMAKFRQFKEDGRTIVVVSHALGTMREMCDEVAWLDHGRVLGVGEPGEIVERYAANSQEGAQKDARRGTGEARITTVTVDPGHGQTENVMSSQPVTLRLEWTADKRVVGAELVLTVRTADGVLLSVETSPGTRTLSPGKGAVSVTIPRLPLAAGGFSIGASIVQPDAGHLVDEVESALELVVHAADSDGTAGLVALGGSWADVR